MMDFEVLDSWVRGSVLAPYFAILVALSCFGIHRWYLLWLYLRHREERPRPRRRFDQLPRLTVQLPIYNELYVVERLVDAVCRLDYPRELLDIQVLDDSTDETAARARAAVKRKRREGHDICYIHRTNRSGFKAGALEAGLDVARGEFVAVFDADFVPPPDFALRLIHHFADPGVGMVQVRWGHLNRSHSPLTRVQAMFLDGHFVVEHTARHRSGRFFNFNGTAGIWRISCIRDAGGWQHDTLTEDLDLSYRAQMRGWKFVYLPDEVAPAELPVEMSAFKSQQHRWAKGSIQTARKLLPAILRSRLPLRVRLEAVFHLTANVGYVLMVALAVLVVPAVWLRSQVSPWLLVLVDLPLFAASSLSVAAFYVAAEREALGSVRGVLRWIPWLMAIGIGLSVNNARAVCEAAAGRSSEFRRTPKYNLRTGERRTRRRYRIGIHRDTWIEAMLALYFAVACVVAGAAGLWAALPFFVLFLGGFGYTAGSVLHDAVRRAGSSGAPA